VITRVWRGWASGSGADRYQHHYETAVLPELRAIPGFRGARLLRRLDGELTEFVSLTDFDDLDAVRAFAGDDPGVAVVAPEARAVLVRFEERVAHYEVSAALIR
jgi:heme-degrading monooxygenase HmoA